MLESIGFVSHEGLFHKTSLTLVIDACAQTSNDNNRPLTEPLRAFGSEGSRGFGGVGGGGRRAPWDLRKTPHVEAILGKCLAE